MTTKLTKQINEISHHAKMLQSKIQNALDNDLFKAEWDRLFGPGHVGIHFLKILFRISKMNEDIDGDE